MQWRDDTTLPSRGLCLRSIGKYNCGLMHRSKPASLFDHLVGEQQERFGDREAERLGSLEIDPQFEFRRLDHRQIGRLFPAQDTGDIDASLPVQLAGVRAIADEAAPRREGGVRHHRGQPVLPGQGDNLLLPPSVVEQRIDMDQQRIGMLLHGPIKCLLYLRFGAGIHDDDVDADAAAGRHEGFDIGGVRILGIDQDGDDRRRPDV